MHCNTLCMCYYARFSYVTKNPFFGDVYRYVVCPFCAHSLVFLFRFM